MEHRRDKDRVKEKGQEKRYVRVCVWGGGGGDVKKKTESLGK